jgi:hypothetical protein
LVVDLGVGSYRDQECPYYASQARVATSTTTSGI